MASAGFNNGSQLSRSARKSTGALRARACLLIMSQICSVAFKFRLHAGQSIRAIAVSSKNWNFTCDVKIKYSNKSFRYIALQTV